MSVISSTQLAKRLNISREYLYILKDKEDFPIKPNLKGKTVWFEKDIEKIKQYIQKDKISETSEMKIAYKTTNINNRRYLGNKYKLLPFIKKVVNENCSNINVVADIFAGTGAVASAFTDKKIITNDLMYSNYICHIAWFSNQSFSKNKIIYYISKYNKCNVKEENYMTENFSDTFFSKEDCKKIGFIREDIENQYRKGDINFKERAILITALLYAMDKIANTCGHYDAYRKGIILENKLELFVPVPKTDLNENNICYNTDANKLVKNIEADLVYIDPPYNSRQYCDAYHLLENVAKWEKPKVFGVAKKMDRESLKSDYCTVKATKAFEDLIKNIKSKYILLSYNNMSEKGNNRSNAKINDEDIMRILKNKGNVKIFSKKYKSFTSGKSNIQQNEERLFLCECFDYKKEIIPSPLNYIGGKFKLLPQILPLFPNQINTFVDLFCGGCNVGINVNCKRAVLNDSNTYLLHLYNTFKNMDKDIIFQTINNIIEKYGLSRSDIYGYSKYQCNGADGLSNYNKDLFLQLREDFNNRKNEEYNHYIMLYVIIVYSFNNQIRFNSKNMFNLPVGKRDFNSKMQEKLSKFIDRIKSNDYKFTSMDFRKFDIASLSTDDFVYIDPPYLITLGSYNEQNAWTEKDELDLLNFIDCINNNEIKFALSNVLESKGVKNHILLEWLEKNKEKYKTINLNYSYSNSNYQVKNKEATTKEVLIINY